MKYPNRQVVTNEVTTDILWAQFRQLLSRFQNAGMAEVEIFFGVAWGNEISPGGWEYIRLPIEHVEERVRLEEQRETGRLGRDDLRVRHPDLPFEVEFCHHSDIHLWFEERSSLINEIEAVWKTAGLQPKEWLNKNRERIEP